MLLYRVTCPTVVANGRQTVGDSACHNERGQNLEQLISYGGTQTENAEHAEHSMHDVNRAGQDMEHPVHSTKHCSWCMHGSRSQAK